MTINTSASGSIAFGGTITGTGAGAQALTLTANSAGTVTLSGNVGATRLGAFAIGAGTGGLSIGTGVTSIAANSFTVNGTVPTTLNNTAPLTINTSVNAGGSIAFGGAITGANPNAQALTLAANGTGSVTFGGTVGQLTPLGALTITSAKTTANAVNIGGNITASAFTIMTASPVTLTNSSIIDVSSTGGGSLLFPSTIDGTNAGVQALTLTPNATGTVTLAGNVGTNVRLGAMTIAGGVSGLTLGSAMTSIQANSFTVGANTPHDAAKHVALDDRYECKRLDRIWRNDHWNQSRRSSADADSKQRRLRDALRQCGNNAIRSVRDRHRDRRPLHWHRRDEHPGEFFYDPVICSDNAQ